MAIRPRILITAGPTREMLDPVRFLSNLSTGEMGYQLAHAAVRKGWEVTLVSGPTALLSPTGVRLVSVITAKEMEQAVKTHFKKNDALIMTAAVCDYTPVHRSAQKIKRIHQRSVKFKRTSDILKAVAKNKDGRYVIGFCLETENLEKNAIRKLREKNLDLIVANSYGSGRNPFGHREVSVLLIDKFLVKKPLSKYSKKKLANYLLTLLARNLKSRD